MGGANIFNPELVHDPDELDLSNSDKGNDDLPLPFDAGQRMTDEAGEEWMFITAGSAISEGSVAGINAAGSAVPITTNTVSGRNRLGICKTAIPNGHSGWLSVKGSGTFNVITGATAGQRLKTHTTSGRLGNAAAGTNIDGISLTATASGNKGVGIWSNPIAVE